jgi:Motility quorum-sensing regulator, toxin of MqsA
VPAWLSKVLKRIKERAAAREVMFTLKARRELAILELGLDEDDACDILARLTAKDTAGRLKSEATHQWMYLFKPRLSGMVLYIKLVIRGNCVVISFHEDAGDDHEEDR